MNLTNLMSRIVAAVHRGSAADGAVLAQDYNTAVAEATARLEAVQTAVNAGQPSDALRIMETPPRLLDVISALEFAQFDEWEALCVDCGWAAPVRIDKTLVDRVLLFTEGKEIVDPLLKMYRKAMRTHDVEAAVRALRQLAAHDASQDWTQTLATAEAELKKKLLADYLAAQNAENTDEALRLATRLCEEPWTEPLGGTAYLPAQTFYASERAKAKRARIDELAVALAECQTGTWNRARAKSLVAALESECDEAVTLTDDQRALVDACCARYEEEDAVEAAEEEARRVAAEAEKSRKKRMRIVLVAAAVVMALLTAGAVFTVRTAAERRVTREVARFDALFEGLDPLTKVAQEIVRVKAQAPQVWADARVADVARRLAELEQAWCVRTNAIAAALARVEELQAQQWPESAEAEAQETLTKIGRTIRAEDAFATARYAAARAAFEQATGERKAMRLARAPAFAKDMMERLASVTGRLAHEFPSPALEREVAHVKTLLQEWLLFDAVGATNVVDDLETAEATLNRNEAKQNEAQKALRALCEATTVADLAAARARLVRDFGEYGSVKTWQPVWATEARIRTVFASDTEAMKTFQKEVDPKVEKETFDSFVSDVKALREVPELCSLYGVRENVPGVGYGVIATGKPKIDEVSKGLYHLVGKLLVMRGNRTEACTEYEWRLDQLTATVQGARQRVRIVSGDMPVQNDDLDVKYGLTKIRVQVMAPERLLPSREYRDFVAEVLDKGEALSQGALVDLILKGLAWHVKTTASEDWQNGEQTAAADESLMPGRYSAYARVQVFGRYLTWLRTLNRLNDDAPYSREIETCLKLATPISIADVEDALTWTCQRNGRVKARNTECLAFFRAFPSDFEKKLRAWNEARAALVRRVKRYGVAFAGKVAYDPEAFARQPRHVGVIANDAGQGATLFVLREGRGGVPALRVAFRPSGKTEWKRVEAMRAEDLVPGEPLFVVRELEKAVEPLAAVKSDVAGLDAATAKKLLRRVPFLEL